MSKPIVVLFTIWLAVISVLVVWFVVAAKPSASVLCEDALLRRRAVEEALRREYSFSNSFSSSLSNSSGNSSSFGGTGPIRELVGGREGISYAGEVKTLEDELAQRNQDVERLCPS